MQFECSRQLAAWRRPARASLRCAVGSSGIPSTKDDDLTLRLSFAMDCQADHTPMVASLTVDVAPLTVNSAHAPAHTNATRRVSLLSVRTPRSSSRRLGAAPASSRILRMVSEMTISSSPAEPITRAANQTDKPADLLAPHLTGAPVQSEPARHAERTQPGCECLCTPQRSQGADKGDEEAITRDVHLRARECAGMPSRSALTSVPSGASATTAQAIVSHTELICKNAQIVLSGLRKRGPPQRPSRRESSRESREDSGDSGGSSLRIGWARPRRGPPPCSAIGRARSMCVKLVVRRVPGRQLRVGALDMAGGELAKTNAAEQRLE